MSRFADDDGRPDPRVLRALDEPDETALMTVLAGARLLTPVVALPEDAKHVRCSGHADGHGHDHDHGHDHGDGHGHDHGHGEDRHAHLGSAPQQASVTILGRDGRRAMLAFSGMPALDDWDPAARPIPDTAMSTARTALEDGCDALILDRGSGHERVLRSSMLWALATGRTWLPAHTDPVVVQAVAAAAASEPRISQASLADGPAGAGVLVLRLTLVPGLDDRQIADLVGELGERLAQDEQVRIRLDSLSVALR